MSDFQKLTEELTSTRKDARRELDEFPPQVRAAWATKINKAKAKVKDLEFKYAKALHRSAVGIFLTGNAAKQDEVAKLVADSREGLVVFADALYREVFAPTIEKLIGKRRTWMVDYTAKLQELLRVWMHNNKVTSAAKPSSHTANKGVPTFDDTVSVIQDLIESGNQQTFNILHLEKLLKEQALKINLDSNTIPVIFLRAPEMKVANSLATALTMKGYAIVDVDQFDGKSGKELLAAVFKAAQKTKKTVPAKSAE